MTKTNTCAKIKVVFYKGRLKMEQTKETVQKQQVEHTIKSAKPFSIMCFIMGIYSLVFSGGIPWAITSLIMAGRQKARAGAPDDLTRIGKVLSIVTIAIRVATVVAYVVTVAVIVIIYVAIYVLMLMITILASSGGMYY